MHDPDHRHRTTTERREGGLPYGNRTRGGVAAATLAQRTGSTMNRESPTGAASVQSSELTDAVAAAVEAGIAEVDELKFVIAEVAGALDAATSRLSVSDDNSSESNAFAELSSAAAHALVQRIEESRSVLETFNIAFFGRTGAGKSTLMSALGGLNGDRVSPGDSDWTTKVAAVAWNGCRLYDTPGTGGWGRTRSRADLEEAARLAVEVSDVVVLCFDTQSQQQAEFERVAEWVRAYGKPAIAVLNFRNQRWLHPAKAHDTESRRSLSDTVRQHVDNIQGELSSIGLPGVPVVALNSKRALTARAKRPYRGPAPKDFESEINRFGVAYLDTWSNLRVLEQLIAACLVVGGTDLRLAALREGLRSALVEWSEGMEGFAARARDSAGVTERSIGQMLDVLGYPDDKIRKKHLGRHAEDGDPLSALERARKEPFDAQVVGRLATHSRHLLRAHLGVERMTSLRRAEDLIMDAFESMKTVEQKDFDDAVFKSDRVAAAIADVVIEVDSFLNDQLQLVGQDAVEDLEVLQHRAQDVDGKAGAGARTAGTLLRASGVLAGGASAVLAVIATTNFWNPAGWMAAAILGGLGVVSSIASFLGKRSKNRAEKQRVQARAKAIGQARSAVSSQFDLWETQQLDAFVERAWGLASPSLQKLILLAYAGRQGISEIETLARSLSDRAAAIPRAPEPERVIARAVELVVQSSDEPGATESDVLLGESWIRFEVEASDRVYLTKSELSAFRRKAVADRHRLHALVQEMVREPHPAKMREWVARTVASGVLDEEAAARVAALVDSEARPPLVLIGDYNSGKTSLVKRLLAEAGEPVPASLVVRANPTTSESSAHSFGRFALVDTPGFQGGDPDHDAAALAAAVDAAVVIMVLNINLLLGDTSGLAELLRGSTRIAGKAGRCIFVIGRIDELGVDPETAPRDFLNRCRRKEAELVSALAAHGLTVQPEQVFSVAADPFGLVGDRPHVTNEMYLGPNRIWDAVGPVVEPLLAIDAATAERLQWHSVIDRTIAEVRRSRQDSADELTLAGQQSAAGASLESTLSAALAELGQLKQSIAARAQRLVDEHADDVIGEALGAGPQEVEAMAENLATWWEDPRLAAAISEFDVVTGREIDEWFENNSSQIGRRLDRMEFATSTGSYQASGDAPAPKDDSGKVASKVMGESSRLISALGNRDAIYAIGKAIGKKFKPWGAVRGGANVARAGAVFGAAVTAFDIYTWVRDSQQENGREASRRAAVDYVRLNTPGVLEHILDGGEEQHGPQAYLSAQEALLEGLLGEMVEDRLAWDGAAASASAQIEVCEELLEAAKQIDPTYQEQIA